MNAWQMLESSKYLREDLVLGNGHLLDQVLKRSGILQRIVHKGAWDYIAEEMLLEFAESGHPTFRATTPLSRGQLKSKGHGKLLIHFAADEHTIETVFRIYHSQQSGHCLRNSGSFMKNLRTIKMDRENLRF